jgi:DMSO/TMAO reductase YedYZ molybdopterin-dependent catalytic subunit
MGPLQLLGAVTAPIRNAFGGKGGSTPYDESINEQFADDLEHYKPLAAHYPEVDLRDLKVADKWVQRHPHLIRLTGVHPFNVEPPLPELLDYGFYSPVNLHIVRNHGAVPRIKWAEHRLTVKGNVGKSITLTMDQIEKMPAISFPCLVTCAGNRRKEQNQIKRSIGFNWGPAAMATTVWTGVPLRHVLAAAGVTKPEQGRRFVCFAGPKNELPKSYDNQQGGPGSYGTSIDMETALDPTSDVILAYKQNGEYLHPDHGYPLRVLIPGYIGGRMVKWLEEIEVTGEESSLFA